MQDLGVYKGHSADMRIFGGAGELLLYTCLHEEDRNGFGGQYFLKNIVVSYKVLCGMKGCVDKKRIERLY